LLLVVGAVALSTRDGEPAAPDTSPPVASATPVTPTPTPSATARRYGFDTSHAGHGEPISLDARRIDGNIVRGEVVLVDVRPGQAPLQLGPNGAVFTYAYLCVSFEGGICITRIHTPARGIETLAVSRVPGNELEGQQWLDRRGRCCVHLTAYAAALGAVSVTLLRRSGLRLEAQRFSGDGWPFPLFLGLGPRGSGFGTEVEMSDGSRDMISGVTSRR